MTKKYKTLLASLDAPAGQVILADRPHTRHAPALDLGLPHSYALLRDESLKQVR